VRAAGRLAAVAAGAWLAWAAPATGAPTIRTDPALKPKFAASRPDYTVRCHPGSPVKLRVDPPDGARAAVDGGKAHAAPFSASADLTPGRAVEVRVRGERRTRRYRVRCLPPDFPRWAARRAGRPQASWYVVTANRRVDLPGYAIVFDAHGVPVWWTGGTPGPWNADVLPNGHLVWTDSVGRSPSAPPFREVTLDGRVVRTFATVGTPTNQHDLQLLPNGNALMISYTRRDGVDLSRWDGPRRASVLDGEIQEVDPAGHVVWRWNTRDHVALRESSHWLRAAAIRVPDTAGGTLYDLVHLNSVARSGDLVVFSARYLDAVYAIDRATGSIAWKLGGTQTPRSLELRGDPLASRDFGGQHDARILDGGRTLTVYDNGTSWKRDPRALELRLDPERRRARLVRSIEFPLAGRSSCCGSARLLAGGDWVVSWGHTPWLTEQTSSGRLVLGLRLPQGYASYRMVPVPEGVLSRRALADGMDSMSGR
jgi:hypothetical protein